MKTKYEIAARVVLTYLAHWYPTTGEWFKEAHPFYPASPRRVLEPSLMAHIATLIETETQK